jgi:hypothetical protein
MLAQPSQFRPSADWRILLNHSRAVSRVDVLSPSRATDWRILLNHSRAVAVAGQA